MVEGRYRLIGSTASPYAIKLRALLRYRRIPFDWVIMTRALRKQTEHLRPNLIPVLQYPDGTFRGETTTLAYDLETRHRKRSVIPEDSAVGFVCDLLEDLADEWAVKPLFLYRWWDSEDQGYVSRWAAEEWSVSGAEPGSPEEIEDFRRRQISRMPILGATAENKPLLEQSYRRILEAFEPNVGMTKYLFGSRQQALSGMAEALLRIAGELYLPFLVANAGAFDRGLERVEINVWGLPYALSPFKYQVKCLDLIREKFAALGGENRAGLRPVLERTGCWAHLAAN